MEKLIDLKIELQGSGGSALRHALKMKIEELDKYLYKE
jgi:hypothetical protein